MQRLQPLMSQIRVHRRHRTAQIPYQYCRQSRAEGGRTELFIKAQSVVAFVRFGQTREFIRRGPVKLSALHNRAAYAAGVSVRVLGRGLNHDIGSQFQGAA